MTLVLCDVCKKEIARNDNYFYGKTEEYTVAIKQVGSPYICKFSRHICRDCADKIKSFIEENTKEI